MQLTLVSDVAVEEVETKKKKKCEGKKGRKRMKGCGGVKRMGSEGTRGAFNLQEAGMVCVIKNFDVTHNFHCSAQISIRYPPLSDFCLGSI